MDIVPIYCKYVCMFFKSRGEYVTSFFAGIIANFYCYLITFIIFWIFVQKFKSIGGWGFSELSILYGLNLLTYAIAGTLCWYTVYRLEQIVINGGLDKFLLRPIGIIPQLMCEGFGYTFIGQIVVTIMFLVCAIGKISFKITFLKIIYLVLALVGGVMLQSGAMIIVGSLSFWILRSTGIGQIFYYDIRGFINYPLNIYPTYIKIIVSSIFPWAFINYYPSIILLNKTENIFDLLLGIVSPVVGFLFLRIALFIFKIGLKRYESSGN